MGSGQYSVRELDHGLEANEAAPRRRHVSAPGICQTKRRVDGSDWPHPSSEGGVPALTRGVRAGRRRIRLIETGCSSRRNAHLCATAAPAAGRLVPARSRLTSNRLRADWLFSYQPNPGTVLFAGYGSTLTEP